MLEKYRVHEVAKDLGVPSKEVVELLEKYFPEAKKKHMASLEKKELDVIFAHYTQQNEVANLDAIFEEARQKQKAEVKEPKLPEQKETKKAQSIATKPAVQKPQPTKGEKTAPPAEQKPQPNQPAHANKPKPQHKQQEQKPRLKTTELPRKKVADAPAVKQSVATEDDQKVRVSMRSVNVNLDKYNERYESIAPGNLTKKQSNAPAKQKVSSKKNKKGRPIMSRKEKEEQKLRYQKMEQDRRSNMHIYLPEEIAVSELANRMNIQVGEIVKKLMTLGVMVSAGEVIDYDTAAMVAMEIGATVEPEVVVTIEEQLFEAEEDVPEEDMESRPPIVVVMGHVDHGKTSTLDAIRKTRVTSSEAGGITQHIGAYQVEVNGCKLTFLDTPGHAAFTSMRARGARITDIAIIVVAADDGIMPQTVEAINHAKAADVDIIIAINKMDKPEANPDKVKQELTEHGVIPEEWGGTVPIIPISAKSGEGLHNLLEMVQLIAEMKELKASAKMAAKGTVIEARLDKGRGPVATLLVQAGTLRQGDVVIAGTALGHVRQMLDDEGNIVAEAGPSTPVEITGFTEVPQAGDIFNAVANERLAKELAEQRRHEVKQEQFNAYRKVTLDNLFSEISDGERQELPIIVKADVQGSVEALTQSLEKISNEEVRVRVIHGAVGAISESDVNLANASNAIIVGFNVRPDTVARDIAKRDDVEIRLYRVIYDAIEEIESAMKGMLAPKYKDVDLGRAEVRETFKVSSIGTIAGCYVTEGKITRNAKIRVVRDGIVIAEDSISSLRRFKDDIKEVATGYECGISLTKFNDIKDGDFLEAFETQEYRD